MFEDCRPRGEQLLWWHLVAGIIGHFMVIPGGDEAGGCPGAAVGETCEPLAPFRAVLGQLQRAVGVDRVAQVEAVRPLQTLLPGFRVAPTTASAARRTPPRSEGGPTVFRLERSEIGPPRLNRPRTGNGTCTRCLASARRPKAAPPQSHWHHWPSWWLRFRRPLAARPGLRPNLHLPRN
jgi:hypothetical protein